MIKYTTGFVDKLEDILEESKYTVRYERGNFQSGWCLLDHKRVVVLNKFLNTEGRVNTLVDLIPQLKIDYDKLTLNSQKLFDFLTENRLEKLGIERPKEDNEHEDNATAADTESNTDSQTQSADQQPAENQGSENDENDENEVDLAQTDPAPAAEDQLSENQPASGNTDAEADSEGDTKGDTDKQTDLENQ